MSTIKPKVRIHHGQGPRKGTGTFPMEKKIEPSRKKRPKPAADLPQEGLTNAPRWKFEP